MSGGAGRKGGSSRRRRWFGARKYDLFFGISLLCLTVLIGWWAIFIKRGLDERYDSKLHTLDLEARVYSLMLGHARSADALLGKLDAGEDVQVRILACDKATGRSVYPIRPRLSHLCITPRPDVVSAIERDHRRKEVMLVGEASLSVLLVLVTGFMLFRLIATENRAAMEIRDLWGRVTHELKSPITGVKALLQTLQARELSRDELAPLLEMALAEVERQERLAENLLVGHRLGGVTNQQVTRLGLMPYLREYFARRTFRLTPEQVRITAACPDDIDVLADPNGLRIILDNLVDNAAKYCDKDRLELVVRVTTEGDWAHVGITDNGPGFAPEVAEGLFKAYRRLSQEPGGTRQGTGMGLFIARRLARENGGELQAASAGPGQGARFTLTLQIAGG